MKRTFVNVLFPLVFLLTFSFLSYSFSSTLAHAFNPGFSVFPKDKKIDITDCQEWTQTVRDFKLKPGEEANRLTVLMYHKIIKD
ncbi:MAG: hypothetical protein ACQEXB_13840 [Bacillota bacterium]